MNYSLCSQTRILSARYAVTEDETKAMHKIMKAKGCFQGFVSPGSATAPVGPGTRGASDGSTPLRHHGAGMKDVRSYRVTET